MSATTAVITVKHSDFDAVEVETVEWIMANANKSFEEAVVIAIEIRHRILASNLVVLEEG